MFSRPEKKQPPLMEEPPVDSEHAADKPMGTEEEIRFLQKLVGHENVSPDVDLHDGNFTTMLSGAHLLSFDEARKIVKATVEDYADDRNFPPNLYKTFVNAQAFQKDAVVAVGITGDWAMRSMAAVMHYSSPYAEVRAVTSFIDNRGESCETFRVYMLLTLFVSLLTVVNQYFSIRNPEIVIPGPWMQVLVLPLAHLMAKILPDLGFTIRGTRHSLNPGPWTYKEQSLFLVALNDAVSPYATFQVFSQALNIFYGNTWATVGYQILLALASQLVGFGLAGIFRTLMVFPMENIYMSTFPAISINPLLVGSKPRREWVNGWSIHQYQLFAIVLVGIYAYQWLPLYLMTFLSTFNWLTWISPNNFNLAAITGSIDGLGFNPILTFDWTIITTSGMALPFFSTVNIVLGCALGGLTIIGVYYSNMYNTAYLPINHNAVFDNTGELYRVKDVLNGNVLNVNKYEQYSPPYYTAASLVVTAASFAVYASICVSTLLYDYKSLWESLKEIYLGPMGRGKSVHDYHDLHSRIMRKYPGIPWWWFVVLFVTAFATSIPSVQAYDTNAPVWAVIVVITLALVFILPTLALYSRTGRLVGLGALMELVIGYMVPGNGVSLMSLKTFGVTTHLQAVKFITGLKVGHYTHIPPRATFRVQLLSTFISTLVCVGFTQYQLNISGVCTEALETTSKFTCPDANAFFSSSFIWGAVGPKRFLDEQYPILKWCFLVGAFIPIPIWACRRFIPQTSYLLKYIEPNVLSLGFVNYSPFSLLNVLPQLYLALCTVFYAKRWFTKWYEKYNFVFVAGINLGMTAALFIIYWALQYDPKPLNWWGSTVSNRGLDGTGSARLSVPAEGHFGASFGGSDA